MYYLKTDCPDCGHKRWWTAVPGPHSIPGELERAMADSQKCRSCGSSNVITVISTARMPPYYSGLKGVFNARGWFFRTRHRPKKG